HALALVQPRARVVIVSTGSELVEPGQPLAPGQISDVNGVMLEACIRNMGASAQRWPSIGDDAGLLARTLQEAAAEFDLVLTTGGVSMGAYDTVKQVLTELGAAHFEKVAMQPGMPQGHGRIGARGTPIITLPGNPVSAFVSTQVFVRPVLGRLHGQVDAGVAPAHAVSAEPFASPAGKVQYVRARLTQDSPPLAHPTGVQGSHILGGLAEADCLLVVPAQVQQVERGDELEMLDLRQESR
ncbi:MAG: molybdopterin molybdotransferase MoeA, partial [Candidatus Nanopelagicales bacterium]